MAVSNCRFGPEIAYQSCQAGEGIGHLLGTNMLVIALARFIVEPQDANLVDHEGQTVLEAVRTSGHRPGRLPDYHFGEPIFAQDQSFTKQQPGFHDGIYTNTPGPVNDAISVPSRFYRTYRRLLNILYGKPILSVVDFC